MTEILLIASITLLLIAIVLIWFRNPHNPALAYLQAQVANLQTTVDKLESGLKEDFRINRIESADLAKANRQELNETLHGFKAEQTQTLATITTQNRQALIDINQTLDDKVKTLTTTLDNNNNLNRESLLNAFKTFQENFDAHIKTFNEVQRDKFTQMLTSQQTLISNTETKLENIRTTVEEKLEKTLSERLGQSFETVGKQLIEVQKGLGEMQTIATDVGGLKKVLSNVKLRGGVGEVQLALLLEQILAPNQYEANVKTKKGSSEPVEFAIKLPGRSDDENAFVYLPIDAKFPKDTYEHLLSAYETANPEEIEAATKNLETTIKKMAKDIRDKYLDPPNTTDFAILFLPFESIYAEVIRRTALIDQLRTEFKITVAGPTTLMAILNSLQMGFRTLALQKRSSEVWQVLATVKKEFENFGGLLEKAQKNIQTGLGQLDDVVGTRTRAINRQLKHVESLPVVNVREEMTESSEPLTDGTED
jgi:DNA recombination protein RmuC